MTLSTNKQKVNSKEVADLYILLGWGTAKEYSTQNVRRMLKNSDLVVSAHNANGELIGLGHALSDGVFYTAIADVIIDPDYQRQGVGRAIMEKIKEKCGSTTIFFETPARNKGFAKKCGYKQRKGMLLFSRRFRKN
jgi:GNAT superfamily N-acetyltransferase